LSDINGLSGNQDSDSGTSEFNAQTFLIQSILSKINTITLVKIHAVSNNDTLSPVGFVDIIPMVNQLDGNGNAISHGVIYHCCYFRMQGGTNAIILDPKVGDIGICAFADKDISSVQINKTVSNPGSYRRFDMADGIYLGGVLNGIPAQYIQFINDGITQSINIVSPTKITAQAPEIDFNAATKLVITSPDLQIIGKTTHTGQVWMNSKRVDETHTHSDPQGGNTGPVN
jgi:hypothetical protein